MGGYSEEDARRIFARAAERQGVGEAPDEGLSLQELESIGQASGIDPAHVAAAAAELNARSTTSAGARFLGLPTTLESTRALSVPVTDNAWGRIVEDLRTTFGTAGVLTEIGETREWTAGHREGRDGVRLTVRPGPDGRSELVVRHSLDANVQSLKLIGGVGLVALITVFGAALASGDSGFLAFSLAVSLLVMVVLAIPTWGLRRSAQNAEREFAPLLDRAERFVHATAETERAEVEREDTSERDGRIHLPDGEPSPAEPSSHRPRRRTR